MADFKKPTFVKITSPIAAFNWPKLHEPDFGTDMYPKPEGEFSTKVKLDTQDPEHAAFIAKIEAAYEIAEKNALAEFAKLKPPQRKKLEAKGGISGNAPFTPIYDDEENETQFVEFKTKKPFKITFKKGPKAGQTITTSLSVFDASGTALKKVPAIGGGSEGRVSLSYNPEGYFIAGTGAFGISLRLEAVQLVTLRQFGGTQSAADNGFGAVSGGYSAADSNGFSDETDDDADDQFTGNDDTDDDEDF